MILQALNRYHDLLMEREGDALPGEAYSEAEVAYEIHLDGEGNVIAVVPYLNEKGKPGKVKQIVPRQAKRANGINPYFLCDKADYLFGGGLNLREECREGMRQLSSKVLRSAPKQTEEISAIVHFLEKDKQQLEEQLLTRVDPPILEGLAKGGLCVLKFTKTGKFFHMDRSLREAWELHYAKSSDTSADGTLSICLITGDIVPQSQIARLHPNIKNVIGAQVAGAAIVSFNISSFCSYGREQSYNAPTSQKAADAYGYVLNRFLADPKHRARMNDTTIVYWAESATRNEQELLASLFQDFASDGEDPIDEDSVRSRVRSAVLRIQQGQQFNDTFEDLNKDTTFYILGLSPNAARLSIRFWYTGTLGEIGDRVWQHYQDISIIGLDHSPTLKELLRELAVRQEWDNIPPNMEGQLLRSLMIGLPYPRAVFAQLMNRIRADSGEGQINAKRAGLIKAYLIRNARIHHNKEIEEELTMALNEHSTNVAYLLGRLFACLERTQQSALGQGINATIRDRFWGAASATPANVFPRLLHLAQHHIAKDEEWGRINDLRIQDVMSVLPEQFPRRLSLEQQGIFVIGYYHQRQHFYTKKSKEEIITNYREEEMK